MEPKNNFRYSFNNRLGLAYVAPLGESDFKIEWNRKDESNLDYTKELPGKVIINGAAYQSLLLLETSVYRCEFTEVTVERNCDGSWVPWFIGRISLNNGAWDLDRCTVEIKFDQVNANNCFDENKSEKINLLAAVTTKRTIRFFPDTLTVETVEYEENHTGIAPCLNPPPYWNGTGTPEAGGWVAYYIYWHDVHQIVISGPQTHICSKKTRWARYAVTVPVGDPSPGSDWIFISSGATDKYVKPVSLIACKEKTEQTSIVDLYEKTCETLNNITKIDNGMHLADVIAAFITAFCPGLTVVSNFFQINPTVSSDTNYVTGTFNKLKNLIFYQKSDVKRPGVSGNATKAEMSFDQLTDALVMMFNTRWRIVGTTFLIEHISFFTKNAGFDLTTLPYAKYVKALRRYTYETDKIPQREEFKFMEASDGDFAGVPIVYGGACVAQENRNNVVTYAVDFVTTDVQLCLNNPESDSPKVDDKGFVLIATEIIETEFHILSEAPILSDKPEMNNPLSWAILHRDYHKYYRPLKNGVMNNVDTVFESVKPTKKGAAIMIPLCCSDVFNPDDIVTAPMGAGIVSKGTFSFRDQSLILELLYEPVENLVDNAPPVADDFTIIYIRGQSDARYIDIAAITTDPQGDSTIKRIEIDIPPTLGTATITTDLRILYTPTLPVAPPDVDNITYRVFDEWNESSNTALITIRYL